MANRLGFKKCIFGKLVTERGTTYRAKSYYNLKNKTTARESYNILRSADIRFAYINGYYYIDTVYVRIWEHLSTKKYTLTSPYNQPYGDRASDDVKKEWKLHGEHHFFREEDLTADIIKSILEFKPRALFGGVIDSYPKKVVPQIKAELLRCAPKLANAVGINEVDYIGMMGQLTTLSAPIDFEKDGLKCRWDGEYVTTTDPNAVDSYRTSATWSNAIGTPVEAYVKFKPFDEVFIEIEDNNWVKQNSIIKTT